MRLSFFAELFIIMLAVYPLTDTWAKDASQTNIRIELRSSNPLSPLYCSTLVVEDASCSVAYAKELQRVLDFDICHNGKTYLMSRSEEKEKLIAMAQTLDIQRMEELKRALGSHVVQCSIKDKKISIYLLEPEKRKRTQIGQSPITGSLASDRRQVHKLADTLFFTLFGKKGIADSRILFSFQRATADDPSRSISEIWECDWDGANAHSVTCEGSYCVSPVLIPKDSTFTKDMFLFVCYKTGQPKILISPLSTSSAHGVKAVDLRGNQLLPAISLHRDKIAFICDASGRADLFVQPIHPENGQMGTPVQLFSYPRSTQASPTFSPDGKKIAFASDKDGSTRIYVIASERGEKRGVPELITKKNRENSCPCWSSDGTKLAYSAKTEGIRQIWIYDFAAREEKQLTSGPGNKENPVWAPNSEHLVFNSTDGASSDLYVVNVHQPEVIKITQGPGKKHYPSWGPR